MKLDVKLIRKNIDKKILNKINKNELSRRLGIKPQSLNTILKGMEENRDCRVSTIKKIAAAGNLNCEELLTE